jgi:hypothetical protein
MRTIALYLDYDVQQKLHSLPFEEIALATEDVYLTFLQPNHSAEYISCR